MREKIKKNVFLFLFLALHFAIGARELKNDFNIRVWTVDDGLPHHSVLSFCQTADGYIWLGTEMGLARFNGIDFRVFNRWNTPSIRENRVIALAEDAEGNLWVGMDGGGICWMKNGIWRSLDARMNPAGLFIHAIRPGQGGDVWVGSENGLGIFRQGQWVDRSRMAGMPSSPIQALLKDDKGWMWAGGEGGLWQERAGENNQRYFSQVFPGSVQSLAQDRVGRVWVGTTTGLHVLDGVSGREVFAIRELAGMDVWSLRAGIDDAMWIGTRGQGLFRWSRGTLLRLEGVDGLSDDYVQTCDRDFQGNLWVGTLAGGINRLKQRMVDILAVGGTFPFNRVLAVFSQADGSLWVGTRQDGVFCRNPSGTWARRFPDRSGKYDAVTLFCASPTGGLWVGMTSSLFHVSNGQGDVRVGTDGLMGKEIAAVLEDPDGTLWVGTEAGLNQRRAGEKSFSPIGPLQGVPVRVLMRNDSGNLLVGTRRGLMQMDGESFREVLTGEEVRALNISRRFPGLVWVGLSGGGLAAMERNRITRFTESDGLLSNRIDCVMETGGTELWMGSPRGVFVVACAELADRLNGRGNALRPMVLNEDDGILRPQCSEGGQPVGCLGNGGELYFATAQGVLLVDRGKWTKETFLPKVGLDEVRFDNRMVATTAVPVLAPGPHLLEFYFSALDFSAPSKARLMYKLEGFDREWKQAEAGKKGAALYYGLKAGKYRFRIRVASGNGNWNPTESVFAFRIASPFPLLLILIPLLVLAAAGTTWYGQRKSKKTRTETSLLPRIKYQTSALTPDRADEIAVKLKNAMDEEKLYLNPSLTLKKLGEKLFVHPNHLSQIVNDRFKQSFKDYINAYRIEEAKKRLLDPVNVSHSILDITYEVGFYSKSVFNTAFKKFTGQTPSEFRSQKK